VSHSVRALAIHANGRATSTFDVVLVVDEDVEEQCRATGVDIHVTIT
jgi:hypothetical protein